MKESLRAAMRARDHTSIAALRSALSAIDNAEAVGQADASASHGGRIAKARLGVGAGDVARRQLTEGDAVAIVRAEIEERVAAAAEYVRRGERERAEKLRAEAAVLQSHI